MARKKKIEETVVETIETKEIPIISYTKTGVEKIGEEREKQIKKHGYTAKHDLNYKSNELLLGALTYLLAAINNGFVSSETWPFDITYYHYEGYESSLKKAGAFIAAELDRINLN